MIACSATRPKCTVRDVADEQVLDVAVQSVSITSPEKVFFSERAETKLDLVRYYLAVAEPLMRVAGGRPTLMQRFPHGAEGSSFFQKRVPDTAPGGWRRRSSRRRTGRLRARSCSPTSPTCSGP